MKTAQQMSDNWTAAMQNPQTATKYKQGIQATTVNPMALAATPQAEQLYLTKVQQSVASGKRSQKLMSVNPQTWKDNASNIGATQLTVGAQRGKAKVNAHFQKWAAVYQQASDAAKAIPKDGSMGSAMARVQAAIQVMMSAAGKT
jgi:hypothetical protein